MVGFTVLMALLIIYKAARKSPQATFAAMVKS